jgi:DNA-binding NarL/FixJ family response regulator
MEPAHERHSLADEQVQGYIDHEMNRVELSERETLILQALADGFTTAEIARVLHLSPRAVATARFWLYARLGAANGPHAVALGLRLGLIQWPQTGPRRWGSD